MKSLWTGFALLWGISSAMAQQDNFEKRLKLDTIIAAEMGQWELDSSLISCLSDGLWEQILPKSILGTDKIILNRNELNYFLELDDIKIQTKTEPTSNPEHWENRFGKQIQTLTLSKPLTVLGIKKGKLTQLSLASLVGLQYATFYPYGELDVPDQNGVPIIFQQENQFDEHSPVLLVTSDFLERMDLETTKINKETVLFGSDGLSGTRYITGIDFNADGQDEIVMFQEITQDEWASEGDESESYTRSMIALYFKDKWHRTSYWQEGPDGIEGF
ncbi:hypothetical protein J0X14_04870 [Muricauda sp. CAU 1633]|uniref:hypothetical protein n=1 Tax=Allomuricauda sp. CAU 1633 TaxID=2816036 RepID=UPI001A903F2F|nr:hypothetical protein [Muricauda sp. CAU 1633]MBO0321621.1 hypothetical protein [Muricauda sp. CAU 1633]